MKRRVRKIANFFAFNLLFFALYLNFIHKDKTGVPGMTQTASQQNKEAFSGTVLVDNPQQNNQNAGTGLNNKSVATKEEESSSALKLSIN